MAATSPCQETRVPHCLTSDSLSFADAWRSLFSSFSDQHTSLQTPDQLHGVPSYTDHSIPFTAGAAVHQSAVFAALFEEMVMSQSCEPLVHVQQPQAASSHSSAVSLCDSAASFSFKTARQSHTAAAGPALSLDTLQPQPHVQQPVAVASLDSEKAGLCVTFKDWQVDTVLQPKATLEDTVQPSVSETHVASSWKQHCSQHSYSKWQAAKRMHSAELQAAVKAVSRPDAASKRVRGKLNAAQRKGVRAVRPWRKPPRPIVVAGGAEKPSSSPVTASQTMHMHLNKVTWWLDLQASQSLGQLPSGVPCDTLTAVPASAASTAVVEHDSPATLDSGSSDAAMHAKLPKDQQVSARNRLAWDHLSGTTRAEGSKQAAEDTTQPPKGSSQRLTGSSQPVDETGRLQQGAVGMSAPPISTSQDGLTSAAVTGSPGSLTVPPRAASLAQTSHGPELQTSSEHEAAADSKAGHAVAATKTAAEEPRQHAKGVGWLQAGDWSGHHSSVPSASTELFLRLEAAAAHEPDASVAGLQHISQVPVASVRAHAANGHHATPSVQCTARPLQAQLSNTHMQQQHWQQQQQQQQRQQMSEQEEDVYAGLERGSDSVPKLMPSWHSAVATPDVVQAQQAPASTLEQNPIGFSTVPLQGPSGMASEQSFFRRSPEHGSLRHGDRPGMECKAERSGKMTPKAAEAPLLKQGSYAVAAKVARLRQQRRQQEVEELNGSQRQVQLAAGGKHPALQVQKHVPTQRGLLIGSYAHPGPSSPAAIAAACSAYTNSHLETAKGTLAFPTLSPLSSRPSTVSANRRYASTLATEASQSGSEAESVAGSTAESAAGSAAEVMWEESWGQVTAPCAENSSNRRRKRLGAAQSQAGLPAALDYPASLAAGRADHRPCQAKAVAKADTQAVAKADAETDAQAYAPSEKAEVPYRLPESASSGAHSRSSAKLQAHAHAHTHAHMHAQHPCKLPVTPPLLRSARVSSLATKQSAVSPVEDEESRLLASLQRLDCKLSGTHKHGSRFESKQAQQAEPSSSRVPSAAQDSPLPASASSRQKPLLPQCAEDSQHPRLPPSTPEVMAVPTVKPAGKRHSRRVSGVTPVQAGTPASPSDVATARGTVNGDQTRGKAGRAGAVQPRRNSRMGTSRRDVNDSCGQADVSNSAEQQALQQSLAKLDARLPYLTARCTGFHNPQSPTSLPSCLSAPITRQSSLLKSPNPHSVMHPLPSSPPSPAANGHLSLLSAAASPSQREQTARPQGSHCPLPARAGPCSWAGSRQQAGQVPQGAFPDASLMLPELSQCPSVASAPCTSGSCESRRHPGLPDKAPGAARAALLARSRIPRPRMAANVPPQRQHSQQQQLQRHQQEQLQQQLQLPHQQQQQQLPQQQQQLQQQQQQQLGMPAMSIGPIPSSHNQLPVSQDPYHYLFQQRLLMPPGHVGLHQPATACVQAASVTAGGMCMQLAREHQHLQPQMPGNASGQQQSALAPHMYRQASACKAQGGFQQWYQQQRQGQSQYQHVWQQQQQQQQQVSLPPLAGQLQHQKPLLQPFGQQQLQQGQHVPASAAPCVQHAWYPPLPGGYQPPLTGPCIASEHMQQLHLGTSVSRAQHAISHMPLPQFGTSHADMLCWTGPDGQSTATDASEAANPERPSYTYNCSPREQGSSHFQQQQQRAHHKQGLHIESSALSPTIKGQKGVIKAYNLKALLS